MNDLSIRRASFLWAGSVAALFLFVSPLAAASGSTKAETCECSVPRPVLPVSLTASKSNQGWMLSFNVPPYSIFTDVLVRFDEQPEESLGHETSLDVMTGKPQVRTWMVLPDDWATPGEHAVMVRMVRRDGTVDGPHKLRFSPGDEALAEAKSLLATLGDSMIDFAEHQDEHTFLMFTSLFGMQDSLREIRYSVDGCGLGELVVIGAAPDAKRPEAVSAERPYLVLPQSTRSACAQVVFRDGTMSKILKVRREPRPGGGKRSDR